MITLDAAAQLEALALTIAAASSSDPNIDSQYYTLIAPIMLTIDGRVMEPGFRYTLNATAALKGRPRHWFLTLSEMNEPGAPFASASFTYLVNGGFVGYRYSYGAALGLATCAGILNSWASIIRLWLAGNYPAAVSQPS